MSSKLRPSRLLATAAAGLALALMPTIAPAQDSIRTGDGLLKVSASMPDSARVGEAFTYNVEVTNTSDNVVLHNIELKQQKAKGFSVESVSMKSDGKKTDKSKNAKSSGQSGDSMKVGMLMPGKSASFTVKATADEQGELRSCLEIVNYTPALCMTAEVVKPELELTKSAPKKANRCDVIELEYTLKNGGSGDVGAMTITDSLGSDLATIEGNSNLKFDVDGLAAGDSRKFVARVYAKKPGEFSSRATAKAKESDLQSRSKKTTTNVIAADLMAELEGPNRIYGDELARFTAKITNSGNAPAKNVKVAVMWPNKANLVDLSDPTMSKEESQSQASNMNRGQPTMADAQAQSSSQGQSPGNSGAQASSGNKQGSKGGSSMNMSEESFMIDHLDIGQTATFDYAIRPSDLDKIPTKVEARYVCTVDAAQGEAKAKSEAMAMAQAEAKVVRLPALQLMVIDDEDPVSEGDQVVYTIRVWNEGDAPDQNIQVTATIPDGLKFSEADGPTEFSQDGSEIKFKPIDKLAPGDRVDYKVTATSTGSDNVRLEVALTSDLLSQEVIGEEPTRLFSRQASR